MADNGIIKKEKTATGYAGYAVVLLAVAVIFGIFFLKMSDYGLWPHGSAGEHTHGHLATAGPDAFPSTAHEWLSGAVFHFIYSIGGASALTVFQSSMITAAFAALMVFAVKRGGSAYVVALAGALAAALASRRPLESPELFTMLFMAVYMCILDSLSAARDDRPGARVWTLPAIMVFWANADAWALFGLIIAGVYAFGEAATAMFERGFFNGTRIALESRRLRTLALVFFITAAAGLVNPGTYHAYTFPFYALKMGKEAALEGFAPPNMAADTMFFTAFAAAVFVIVLNIKKAKVEHLTLFALFSYAAFRYSRNIPAWAVIMMPLLAVCADEMKNRLVSGRAPLDKSVSPP